MTLHMQVMHVSLYRHVMRSLLYVRQFSLSIDYFITLLRIIETENVFFYCIITERC